MLSHTISNTLQFDMRFNIKLSEFLITHILFYAYGKIFEYHIIVVYHIRVGTQ